MAWVLYRFTSDILTFSCCFISVFIAIATVQLMPVWFLHCRRYLSSTHTLPYHYSLSGIMQSTCNWLSFNAVQVHVLTGMQIININCNGFYNDSAMSWKCGIINGSVVSVWPRLMQLLRISWFYWMLKAFGDVGDALLSIKYYFLSSTAIWSCASSCLWNYSSYSI